MGKKGGGHGEERRRRDLLIGMTWRSGENIVEGRKEERQRHKEPEQSILSRGSAASYIKH